MNETKRKHIGQYEVGRTLGQGSFGKVKLGTDIFTGEKVAIKIISHGPNRTEKELQRLERERKILLKLSHPNIVNLIKVVDDPSRNKCYMIFEYVNGGELFDYIVNHGRLSEVDSRKFMRQIISAVEYCHSVLVIHRDLKPENLLLDDKLNIKITDFGLSNIMEPGKKFQTFCGSLHYACPEILRGKEYLGPGVDIWSMGIILYCLVVGRQPWDGANAEELMSSILGDGLEIPQTISDDCVDLILAMLRVKEEDRIPVSQMRHHPWIMEGYDAPPPCYLPDVKPIDAIDHVILEQMQSMGFITPDTIESVKSALIKGDKENQAICIYHLLAKQQSAKKPSGPIKPSKNRRDDEELRRTRSHSAGTPKRSIQSIDHKNHREEKSEKRSSTSNEKEKSPEPLSRLRNSREARKRIIVTTPTKHPQNSYDEPQPSSPPIQSVLTPGSSQNSPRTTGSSNSSPREKDQKPMSRGASPKKVRPGIIHDEKDKEISAKARTRSASLAPKSKKTSSPSPSSPTKAQKVLKKPERPVLSLTDISSGKLHNHTSSAPSSPVPIKQPRTPRGILQPSLFQVEEHEEKGTADEEKSLPIELKTKLISTLPSSLLRLEIERVLNFLRYTFKKKGDLFKCATYVEDGEVTFSVEIIKISSQRAVKIKRLGGSGFGYKMVHERLVQELNL